MNLTLPVDAGPRKRVNGGVYLPVYARRDKQRTHCPSLLPIGTDAPSRPRDHQLVLSLRRTIMSAFKTKNLYHLRISANSVLPLYVERSLFPSDESDTRPCRCTLIPDTSTG